MNGFIKPTDAVFVNARRTLGQPSWDWRARPTGDKWRRLHGLRVQGGQAEGQFRNRSGLYWSTMDALSAIGGG